MYVFQALGGLVVSFPTFHLRAPSQPYRESLLTVTFTQYQQLNQLLKAHYKLDRNAQAHTDTTASREATCATAVSMCKNADFQTRLQRSLSPGFSVIVQDALHTATEILLNNF